MSFELNFCLLLLEVMYIHVAAGEWENDEAGQPKDNEGDDIRPRHFRYRGERHGNGNGIGGGYDGASASGGGGWQYRCVYNFYV